MELNPLLEASETIREAERSLKLLVGFRVSSFKARFFKPRASASLCASCRGVPPSPRLTCFLTEGSTGLYLQNFSSPVNSTVFRYSSFQTYSIIPPHFSQEFFPESLG